MHLLKARRFFVSCLLFSIISQNLVLSLSIKYPTTPSESLSTGLSMEFVFLKRPVCLDVKEQSAQGFLWGVEILLSGKNTLFAFPSRNT